MASDGKAESPNKLHCSSGDARHAGGEPLRGQSSPLGGIIHVAGPQSNDSKLDILFIHSLGEEWAQTWDGLEYPESWLQTLLPKDLPNASILTYGFDVLDGIETDSECIKRAAELLIHNLEQMRTEDDRPIIFVAHSLGGIVLREALMHSSNVNFGFQVQGVIFIGTPNFSKAHQWTEFGRRLSTTISGSRNTSLASPSVVPTPAQKPFEQLVSISSINKKFEDWLQTTNLHSVYCFHEMVPIYRVGLLVPAASSSIAGVSPIALHADHTSITKFDNSMDQSYRLLSRTLRKLTKSSVDMLASIPDLEQRPNTPRPFKPNSFSGLPATLDGREVLTEAKGDIPKRAARLANLALALEDLGRFKDAETYYRQAIEEFNNETAAEDPIYLFCLHKLAGVLRDRSQYAEAESRAREAWRARLSASGPSHPRTLLSAGSLARILRFRGKYEEAYTILSNALGPFEACPYDSIGGSNAVSILAKILKELGLYSVSELLARNVVGACMHYLGPDHPYTFNRLSDLAVVLSKQFKFDAAFRVGQNALNGLRRTVGTDHPHTLRTAKRVANYMRFQGNLEGARELLQQTVRTQNRLIGARDNDMLSTTCSLAAVNALLGNFPEALESLETALEDRRKLFGNDHVDSVWTQRALESVKLLSHQNITAKDIDDEIRTQSPLDISKSIHLLPGEHTASLDQNESSESTKPSSPKEPTVEEFKKTEKFKSIVKFLISPTVPAASNENDERKAFDALFCSVGQYGKDLYTVDPGEARNRTMDSNSLGIYLQSAAARNDEEVVRILLARTDNPRHLINISANALQGAAYGGNPNIMRLLLDWFERRRTDLHRYPKALGRALRVAAATGNVELIEMLLSHGADVNGRGAYFGSALQAACYRGHVNAVNYLIKKRADVNLQAGLFASPLRAATFKGHTETARILLDNGAKLMVHENGVGSAIQTALASNDPLTLRCLFEPRGTAHSAAVTAAVNWEDSTFGTPLQEAAWAENESLVADLLANGADPNIHSGVLESPLELAAASGNVKIVDLLLERGEDDNLDDYKGALLAAAIAGEGEVVDSLLDDERSKEFTGFGTTLQAASIAERPDMTRKIYERAKASLESEGVHSSMDQAVLTYSVTDSSIV